MTDRCRTLVVLSPAFPGPGPESTWVFSQQLMVESIKRHFPEIPIVVLAFFFPDRTASYGWKGARVISFNGLGQRSWRRVFLWLKIWKTLYRIHREQEVGGIISFWCGECALLGSYFGRLYGIRHYTWICGQDARASNRYVRFIRPRAGELVAMSRFLALEFQTNHGTLPLHLIPNGIDPAQFDTRISPRRDIDILGVGSLEPLKRYGCFVRVLHTLRDSIPALRATLCGQGSERENLEILIKTFRLEETLQLKGLTPHHEVVSLMQRSKVLLHTSGYEGFSTVCLEALCAGAHVISFCDPMQGKIPHWHVVRTTSEMTGRALELLKSPHTDYTPVMVSSMLDSARAFVKLVYGFPIKEGNMAFYNGIADLYNETMEKDPSNLIIRRMVQKKVNLLVPSGRVIDFGGGTGLDLEWLAEARTVIFCEPSERMREKAHARRLNILHGDRIVFLDNAQTDYTRWGEADPFMGTLDAALCNFGVINYIPDLEKLFSSLAGVLKPGGHIFVLALKYGFVKRFRRHRRHALASLFTRQPFVLHIPGEKGGQTVIIHTIAQIDRASGPWFHMDSCDILGMNDFMLIHLLRK